MLSGDAVHFQSNWDNRRIPTTNTDQAATLASMQRLSEVMEKEHARLWINHDKVQSDGLKRPPDFYD